MAKAQEYVDAGDLRFAAELLNHAVFADEGNRSARSLLADVYDTLGFGSENGTWRNFYLQGAYELRHEVQPAALDSAGSARHDRGALGGPAIRCHRNSGQWTQGLGRAVGNRLGLYRRRPHLPDRVA